MTRHLIILILGSLFSVACFSQFTGKQERKIKLAEDSARQVNKDNFMYFDRIHYGILLGYHQGFKPEIEIGLHRTITDSDDLSSVGLSTSYIRNIKDSINTFCVSGWFGLVGLLVKTNTKDFKQFSYSFQPILGVEYKFLHLFYGYNINIADHKTPTLNTHTITLRAYLWFITRKGKAT